MQFDSVLHFEVKAHIRSHPRAKESKAYPDMKAPLVNTYFARCYWRTSENTLRHTITTCDTIIQNIINGELRLPDYAVHTDESP